MNAIINQNWINTWVREGEQLDDLNRKGYQIIQNHRKFCFGMDAVLLCGFAQVKPGEQVLDLGTGTGIIPILLEARTEGGHFTGLEIQPEMADMAGRSAAFNRIEDKVTIREGDIKEASRIFGRAVMDVVTCNPPYMNDSHGLKNPGEAKAIARHEVLCNLDDVIREGTAVLKPGGRFYMVHRPHRLTEILLTMKSYKLEPKRIRMVHSFADSQANMVLIEGVRGGNPWLKAEPPLIIYREKGCYTQEIRDIYDN